MWAQWITMRLKPGNDTAELDNQFRPRSSRDRYALVVFESADKARAREQDPRRQEAPRAARATMAGLFDGPPEFTDLRVAGEWAG